MCVDVERVLRAMEETAQVTTRVSYCFNPLYLIYKLFMIISFFIPAVISGCSPSCGPNSFCQEDAGAPSCTCKVGYQGDGYNCTGTKGKEILFCMQQ